jgi:hypothetical protein
MLFLRRIGQPPQEMMALHPAILATMVRSIAVPTSPLIADADAVCEVGGIVRVESRVPICAEVVTGQAPNCVQQMTAVERRRANSPVVPPSGLMDRSTQDASETTRRLSLPRMAATSGPLSSKGSRSKTSMRLCPKVLSP